MFRKSSWVFRNGKKIFHVALNKKKLSGNSNYSFKRISRDDSAEGSLYYKATGLSHLNRLSKFLKRSINIWSKDRIICAFGKYSENSKINVEYVESQLTSVNQCFGHYMLKSKKESYTNAIKYPNNCLFDVLASQTGDQPNALRRKVIKHVRKKSNGKVLRICSSTSNRFPNAPEIHGGARYNEKSKDAKNILDLSQNGQSHPNGQSGHPRGHASYAGATGFTDSVENYSKNSWKTGFLSRSDQDFVAHWVLKSSDAQDAMELLNELGKNANREAVRIRAKDLPVDDEDIPKAQQWTNEKRQGEPGRIRDIVLVMKHFYEKYHDDSADVFVLTLYPTL